MRIVYKSRDEINAMRETALVVSGIDRKQIDRLDPVVCMILVRESHRRSHLTEADRGN